MTELLRGGVTAAVLGPLLGGDPHAPRLVVHTELGRTELSTASLANWSSKVAGLMTDELGLPAGERVLVRLGAGWQTAPILFGCWWAGLVVCDSGPAEVAFVADGEDADADEVFVVSGHPLGAPSSKVQAHQRDFTVSVLPQADRFGPGAMVTATDPALSTVDGEFSSEELLSRARLAADLIGVGGRLLSESLWTFPEGLSSALLAPLLADGSLVQWAGTGADWDAAAVAGSERATVTLGLDVAGLPRIDPPAS